MNTWEIVGYIALALFFGVFTGVTLVVVAIRRYLSNTQAIIRLSEIDLDGYSK